MAAALHEGEITSQHAFGAVHSGMSFRRIWVGQLGSTCVRVYPAGTSGGALVHGCRDAARWRRICTCRPASTAATARRFAGSLAPLDIACIS